MKHRFKVDLGLHSIDCQVLGNQKWYDVPGRNYEALFKNSTLK